MGKTYANLFDAARDGLVFWCRTCGRLYKTLAGAMNHRVAKDHVIEHIAHLLVRFEPADPDEPFSGPHPFDGLTPSDAV